LGMKKFGLVGAAGYIAPRHMKAIKDTGNLLVCALDPKDSVGIIDSYFPEADFFIEPERFDRFLEKSRRVPGKAVDYVSICSPNYLHDAHIRMALRNGADAICEKPIVLNPWNLDALSEIERETGKRIWTILQLRLHPAIQQLKRQISEADPNEIYDIDLKYITSRGNWYHISWKGNGEKSGGIATNIGVHFFDMLTWIFGAVEDVQVDKHTSDQAAGFLKLKQARVNWMLSINENHLPGEALEKGKRTYRSLTMNGQEIEFSDGFTELHTLSYQQILQGNGFGLDDARQSIEIVQQIRQAGKSK
jgi:UDP-N-acetyl-2-amino-2-deoxyglucuronate dehydrogenase